MEKKYKVKEDRGLILNISNNSYISKTSIDEYFFNQEKSYNLVQTDDYLFTAYINDDKNINKLTFEFDENHPLYYSLLNLLKNDKSIIIDDDDTLELNKKYLEIKKEDEIIKMIFVNNSNDYLQNDKFNIFIKNIMVDLRSKIDIQGLDTKERLINFFDETRNELKNGYHQITTDEYILKKELKRKYD